MFYIYSLNDPITGERRYIGQSKQPGIRLTQHIYGSKKLKTYKDKWVAKLLQHQLKPTLEILCETLDPDQAEIDIISLHRVNGCRIINATDGGGGIKNPNDEVIQKIKNARSTQIFDDAARKKMSESAFNRFRNKENHPKYGKHLAEEVKARLSEANRGKKLSEETKEKIKVAMTGASNHFYGRKHSEESKRKIRDTKAKRSICCN